MKALQETISCKQTDCHPDHSKNKSIQHLPIYKVILLDPELQSQGGDVECGAQVGGVGGGVRSLKSKFCHILMVNPPAKTGRNRRLTNL